MQRSTFILASLPALIMLTSCADDSPSASNSSVAEPAPSTSVTAPPTTPPPTTSPPPTTPETTPDTTLETATTTTIDPNAPSLTYFGVLKPGAYIGNKFAQPISFEITIPWHSNDTLEALVLTEERPAGDTTTTGEIGFDVSSGLPFDEAVTAVQTLEGVAFGEPVPTSIAGFDGVKFEAPVIPEQVVVSFMFNDSIGEPWVLFADTRHEVHVLDRPGDTALILWIDGPEETWETFRGDVEAVLSTIAWSE